MSKALPLDGSTILLVEDDALIGMDLIMTFEAAGAMVQGPFATVDATMASLRDAANSKPDCAVLDYRLGEETCDRVAAALQDRGIPLVIHTGDPGRATTLAVKVNAVIVTKPSETDQIINAVIDNLL